MSLDLPKSTVRVLKTGLAFGGWKATAQVDGDVLRVTEVDGERRLDIPGAEVKRYSYNGNNGMWAIRMKDGRKLYLQSAGLILSADRSPAGKAMNAAIMDLFSRHQAGGFTV